MVNKVDSNLTGLSYSEEASIGVAASGTLTDGRTLPLWFPLEPNSYKEFGADITTMPRNPINASRQRRKGSVVDLTASGGFMTDVTTDNLPRLLQGYMFADAREKRQTAPLVFGTQGVHEITSVTSLLYNIASPTFVAGDLILAEEFTTAANNGLKVATAAVAATSVSVAGLTAEAAPPFDAKLTVVGFQFGSADAVIDATSTTAFPMLTTTAKDLTTLGLTPGEWVFLGGDDAGTQFATAANNGFARIYSIATNAITFDKTSSQMVDDTGTGKTIRMFFGTVIRNENVAADIVRRSYRLERTLGSLGEANDAVEYVTGAVANELTLAIKSAAKVEADLSFTALTHTIDDGAVGPDGGTRIVEPFLEFINTSVDFVRMNIGVVSTTNALVTPLFAYLTDVTMSIKNNAKEDKAIGVLGGFDMTAGSFELQLSVTAYFNNADSVRAVRENPDVTVDFVLAKENRGLVFDVPLGSLGGGRLNVVQDQAIMLPITTDAGINDNGYTLMAGWFQYLPDLATA